MKNRLSFCLSILCVLSLLCSTGCVMKRTVTDGGSVVSEKYIVKRPIKDAIEGNSSSNR